MSPRLRHFPQGGNAKSHFQWWKWLMRRFAVVSVAAGLTGLAGFGACFWRDKVLSTPNFHASGYKKSGSFPYLLQPLVFLVLRFSGFRVSCHRFLVSSVLRSSGFSAFCPWFPVPRSLGPLGSGSLAPAPWLRLLGSGSLGSLGPSWLSLLPRLAPHRHPAADYLRASLASMHSVAWGTFIRRSFGMSLPVVLQMP